MYHANTTVSDFKVPQHEYAVFCSSGKTKTEKKKKEIIINKSPQKINNDFFYPTLFQYATYIYYTPLNSFQNSHKIIECFIQNLILHILNCIDTIIPLKVTTATPILGRFPSMIDRVKWWLYLTDHTHQHPSKSSPQSFRLREQNGNGVIATWRCACVVI